MTNTTSDPFLAGGDSLPGFKFSDVGDKLVGQITAMRQVNDTDLDGVARTWPNGDPRMVWVFDIDTNEDGDADFSLWVRGNMYTVLRDALKDAGVPTIGAIISLTHHALGDPPKKGYHPPKLFTAKAKAGPPLKPKTDEFTAPAKPLGDEEPF